MSDFTLEEKTSPIPNSLKNYWIGITIEMPYPKEYQYTERANFCGTAINRALKKLRSEVKGKHLRRIRITASRL